ncbi:DUF3280 domain-containing protein [Thalassococcus sp. BH17M4-6]|uniref:DUF3280 domain-containing protein n=1 Tax=Thalassococcus sp. BH17M4-6 TaxID=3413148 RepID=UPI003BC1C437
MKHLAALLSVLIFCGTASAQAPQNQTPLDPDGPVAFFGVTFLDTSTEGDYFGERADQSARIELMEDYVRDWFTDNGFAFVDLAPVREELDRTVNPADCYGCELRMGEKLDAAYVLVGEVQKVSNLILSMNLVMRDVETGRMVRGQSVEIRSNTDDSWLRGTRYILKNNFFKS